jgi:hypothetical protein
MIFKLFFFSGQTDRSVSPVTIVNASPKAILKKSANGKLNGHGPVITNGHTHHHQEKCQGKAYLNGYHNDVYTNSDFDPDDSLEGTSVDDGDSDKEDLSSNSPLQDFLKAEDAVTKVAKHIQVALENTNIFRIIRVNVLI